MYILQSLLLLRLNICYQSFLDLHGQTTAIELLDDLWGQNDTTNDVSNVMNMQTQWPPASDVFANISGSSNHIVPVHHSAQVINGNDVSKHVF